MIKFSIIKYLFFFYLISITFGCLAAIEVYEFDDPKLASRFQQLTYELRCPKCQNQNLADSDSTLSLDLKQIVYEKLKAGESDQQILDFMKQRYGEFILFNPEMNQSNAFLWSGPLIFLFGFIILFVKWYISNKDPDNE